VVKVVTDSTSDLPPQIAEELGITVVPVSVRFGNQTYRDGVDITPEQLYERMVNGPVHPTTSAPAPGEFVEVYRRLSRETEEILCLTISSKLSAIYQAATTGKQSFGGKCRIEVVDTQLTTMCLGLVAMLAAREAQAGKSLDEVLAAVRAAIPRSYGMALLDTARHVLKGGRLGRSGALLGALVRVKPMLEIKEGWVRPSGVTRTRSMGMDRLCQFVTKHIPVEDIAVVQGNAPEEAEELAGRIRVISPRTPVVMAKLGSAIGVHAGPGTVLVALRESPREAEKADGKARARKFTLPTLRIPRRQ
jgi:DegV family protein with EDD domain